MSYNPLLSPQREKSGSSTYSKYGYQYHWALFRVIEQHELKKEYAVFVELHEDVVIANSLDVKNATFEFNQVKTNKNRFTDKNLIKKTKTKPSVLGKLLSSCLNKDYSESIEKINLVSTSGFNLSLKNPDLDFEVIKISDIKQTSFKDIEQKLIDEIGCEGLPENLQFIIPSLPVLEYQDNLIGKISRLIKTLYPKTDFDSVDIYRTLIDELDRKGKNMFDYKDWNDALRKKALTSVTVTTVINDFTCHKGGDIITSEFDEIANELGLKIIQRKNLKNAFSRYRSKRIGSRTANQLQISSNINSLINENINDCNDNIETLIDLISKQLPRKIFNQFTAEIDLKGAIIFEYIIYEQK